MRLTVAALMLALATGWASPTLTPAATRTLHHPRRSHRKHHAARPRTAPRLIWSDNFNGPAGSLPDPTKWQLMTGGGGWGNKELECYTARPSNVSLDGAGDLAITARSETYTDAKGRTCNYTSARIDTYDHFDTQYGRIEARIKLPAGRGLWPTFWAMGTDIYSNGWPYCGEIDMMEHLGRDPFTQLGSIHGPQSGAQDAYGLTAVEQSSSSLADGYHTYGMIWSRQRIVFTFDGAPYATRTPASLTGSEQWVFDKPVFLLLNLAVGGTWPGPPDGSTRFPATMLVDWVRVYS